MGPRPEIYVNIANSPLIPIRGLHKIPTIYSNTECSNILFIYISVHIFTVRGVPYHFTIRASTNGGYGETEEIIFFSQELG